MTVTDYLLTRGPYLLPALLIATGIYALVLHKNYVKTVVALFLLQSGIILFFIAMAAQRGATVPILLAGDEPAALHNPLPHAMMLTAIVVGVATLGVAMAILRRIQVEEGSIRQAPPGLPGDEGLDR